MSASVFSCGRPKLPRCGVCDRHAIAKCAFELRGKKAGQTCDKSICAEHNQIVDGKRVCLPHARLMTSEVT